jgi:hypothetical protein
MKKTNFFIVGPDTAEGESQFWSIDLWGWTDDYDQASSFGKEILAMPLPRGTQGIMEYSVDHEPVKYFEKNSLTPLDNQ